MEDKFQNELRCLRRNRGESFRELAQDIHRIMILAYPGEPSSISEHLARDTFLSALSDPEFGLKIGEREPKYLDDAFIIVRRYEILESAVDSSVSLQPRVNRQADAIYSADGSSSGARKSVVQTADWKSHVDLNGSSKRRDLKTDDSFWKEEIIQRLGNLDTLPNRKLNNHGTLTTPRLQLQRPPGVPASCFYRIYGVALVMDFGCHAQSDLA